MKSWDHPLILHSSHISDSTHRLLHLLRGDRLLIPVYSSLFIKPKQISWYFPGYENTIFRKCLIVITILNSMLSLSTFQNILQKRWILHFMGFKKKSYLRPLKGTKLPRVTQQVRTRLRLLCFFLHVWSHWCVQDFFYIHRFLVGFQWGEVTGNLASP